MVLIVKTISLTNRLVLLKCVIKNSQAKVFSSFNKEYSESEGHQSSTGLTMALRQIQVYLIYEYMRIGPTSTMGMHVICKYLLLLVHGKHSMTVNFTILSKVLIVY